MTSSSHGPAGVRVYQNIAQADGRLRRQNLERLRDLAAQHSDQVTLICSDDPVLLERARGA